MPREDWLVLGISGATCSGKSSLAKQLQSLFNDAVLLHQDDYFHDVSSDKHVKIPELNHINFEILSSVDMDAFKNRIRLVLESEERSPNLDTRRLQLENNFRQNFTTSEMIPANECLLKKMQTLKYIPNILILDGFLIFNDEEIRDLCDIKCYFTLDKATCWSRRKLRSYEPPDVPGYFEQFVWPTYITHFEQVLRTVKNVYFFDGADSMEHNFRSVLHKLLAFLS